MLKIGVDLMGNENSPEALLAILREPKLPLGVELVAFGLPEFQKNSGMRYIATKEFISSEDPPLIALRQKKESSLSVGLRHLKAKDLDAFVSEEIGLGDVEEAFAKMEHGEVLRSVVVF